MSRGSVWVDRVCWNTYIQRVATMGCQKPLCPHLSDTSDVSPALILRSHQYFCTISKFSTLEREMKTGTAGSEKLWGSQMGTIWRPISWVVAPLSIKVLQDLPLTITIKTKDTSVKIKDTIANTKDITGKTKDTAVKTRNQLSKSKLLSQFPLCPN